MKMKLTLIIRGAALSIKRQDGLQFDANALKFGLSKEQIILIKRELA